MSATPPAPTSPPTTDRQTLILEETREFFEAELKMGDSAATLTEEVEESEGASVEAIEEEADEEESTLSSTGNEFLDSELTDLHAFFTLETEAIDADNLELQQQQIWIRLTLPLTLRCLDSKSGKESFEEGEFVLSFRLKLTAPGEENVSHYEIVEYKVDELWPEASKLESKLKAILTRLTVPSTLSMVGVIEEFYLAVEEELNYPDKIVSVRDFFYPIFGARHWGRHSLTQASTDALNANSSSAMSSHHLSPSSPTAHSSYRARALYDFQALMQGELSFQENDILQVFANLGNGWLTARKVGDEAASGLIPENYIERL